MSQEQSSQPTNFQDKVTEYLSNNKVCLYILTPHYGGMCYVNYMNSLIATISRMKEVGVELHIEFCNNDS